MGKKSATAAAAKPANGNTAAAGPKKGPETITLPNGVQVPVGLPPGVSPAQYEQALAYLRANPHMAQQTAEQMGRVMSNPEMAHSFIASQQQLQDPDSKAKMEALKDDPELAHVFDDIKASGPAAMERYWNDTELMTKISQKMSALGVSPVAPAAKQPKSLPVKADTLHGAAKLGDAEAAETLLQEGTEVNEKDARGITALGVAVGFNKLPVIEVLLRAGADVTLTDAKGNTPLHYAAGYGRKEAAELLLEAGAQIGTLNNDELTPADAAKMNREMHMVAFLDLKSGKKPVTEKDVYL